MKRWKGILLVLLLLIAGAAAYVFVLVRSIEVEQLSEDLFVLRGFGGNSGRQEADDVYDALSLGIPTKLEWNKQVSRSKRRRFEVPGQDSHNARRRSVNREQLP